MLENVRVRSNRSLRYSNLAEIEWRSSGGFHASGQRRGKFGYVGIVIDSRTPVHVAVGNNKRDRGGVSSNKGNLTRLVGTECLRNLATIARVNSAQADAARQPLNFCTPLELSIFPILLSYSDVVEDRISFLPFPFVSLLQSFSIFINLWLYIQPQESNIQDRSN